MRVSSEPETANTWTLPPPAVGPGRDDFDPSELAAHRLSLRHRPPQDCTTKERPGWLPLHARRRRLARHRGGRYLSTEVAGGFTGRVIGMSASAGVAHFD